MKIYKVYKIYYAGHKDVWTKIKSFANEQSAKTFCENMHKQYAQDYKIKIEQVQE